MIFTVALDWVALWVCISYIEVGGFGTVLSVWQLRWMQREFSQTSY